VLSLKRTEAAVDIRKALACLCWPAHIVQDDRHSHMRDARKLQRLFELMVVLVDATDLPRLGNDDGIIRPILVMPEPRPAGRSLRAIHSTWPVSHRRNVSTLQVFDLCHVQIVALLFGAESAIILI